MSLLYITEHARQGRDSAGYVVQGTPEYPTLAEQVVAIGAGSVASAVMQPTTTIVILISDVTCSVAVSATPAATILNRRMPANVPVQIAIAAGAGYKIAVIANT